MADVSPQELAHRLRGIRLPVPTGLADRCRGIIDPVQAFDAKQMDDSRIRKLADTDRIGLARKRFLLEDS